MGQQSKRFTIVRLEERIAPGAMGGYTPSCDSGGSHKGSKKGSNKGSKKGSKKGGKGCYTPPPPPSCHPKCW